MTQRAFPKPMIKRILVLFAASCCIVPLDGRAQSPAPAPPLVAPVPPSVPSAPRDVRPEAKSPVDVFLGVETTPVPAALRDQLDLPTGFGLLVDYVVPGSPAETAGVKAHDVLKMLDAQILTGERQLSVLVRSFHEGQAVNLLVLRKGQETKLTATLRKRSAHDPHEHSEEAPDDFEGKFDFDADEVPDAGFSERLQASLERSRAKVEAATARAQEQARRAMEIARDRTTRATGSRLDYDDARVLLRDAAGRTEIRAAHGKRTLTLRDADGKKTFEGPIDTPEQRKAIPTDALPRVEALESDGATAFPGNDENNAHGD